MGEAAFFTETAAPARNNENLFLGLLSGAAREAAACQKTQFWRGIRGVTPA
jgi:hypothetical protein